MRRTIILAVAATLVAAACAAAGSSAADGRIVRMTLKEFAYAPSRVTLRSGELVTLELANRGTLYHELMAGRGEILPHGGYADDLFGGVETRMSGNDPAVHSHGGFGILVAKGTTARLTFVVPDRPGTYEMGCFEAGHYLAGMVGRIEIERR
jgi:uncharacterized cupredoxin-like copper-binding protein